MKLDYHQRAYLANCARRRALELYQSAEQTRSDRQKVDLQEEARYVEALAIDLDNGEDLQMERPTPISARPDLDLELQAHRS